MTKLVSVVVGTLALNLVLLAPVSAQNDFSRASLQCIERGLGPRRKIQRPCFAQQGRHRRGILLQLLGYPDQQEPAVGLVRLLQGLNRIPFRLDRIPIGQA